MANINNEGVSKRIIDEAKLQVGVDRIPNQLAEKVVPVMNVNATPLIKNATNILTDGTAITLLTASSTKDTYIVGATISYAKDATNTSTNTAIKYTPYAGAASSANVLIMRYEPSTAGQDTTSVSFNYPLRVERGSTVTINNSNGTASIDASAILHYYEV